MRTLNDTKLTATQREALSLLRQELLSKFDIHSMSLFGSYARGDFDDESDIDLLVVTNLPLENSKRYEITEIVCRTNLEFGTNFSSVVIARAWWESGKSKVLPIHDEVMNEGTLL